LQPQVEKFANDLIDEFADKGEVEFIEEFCYPLPMMVITIVLGLPQEDLEDFKRWSIAWVAPYTISGDAIVINAREENAVIALLYRKIHQRRCR